MSLDHYVSQVHLKNFYSPALDGLMYATRKSDLKTFQCNSDHSLNHRIHAIVVVLWHAVAAARWRCCVR